MTDAQKSRIRKLMQRLTLCVVSCSIGIALVETGLRVIRDENRNFPYYRNSLRVAYPRDEATPGVSDPSFFRTNSIGTRGPEYDGEAISLITIGGSTTACSALDDSESWPHLVMEYVNEDAEEGRMLWVTNSGNDGLNSHHHIMHAKYLLPQIPRLDYALYHVGLNDLCVWLNESSLDADFLDNADNWASRVGEAFSDSVFTPADDPWYKRLELWKQASVARSALNARRVRQDRESGRIVEDDRVKWLQLQQAHWQRAPKVTVGPARMSTHPAALEAYASNLTRIISLTREAGVEPILMAQALSSSLMEDAERGQFWMGAMDGGKTYIEVSQLVELLKDYNDAMKKVAREQGVLFMDLPRLLAEEKEIFFDGVHFNERGGRVMGRRVSEFLWETILAERARKSR